MIIDRPPVSRPTSDSILRRNRTRPRVSGRRHDSDPGGAGETAVQRVGGHPLRPPRHIRARSSFHLLPDLLLLPFQVCSACDLSRSAFFRGNSIFGSVHSREILVEAFLVRVLI